MEGIQTIQALKAVQSSLPAQTTIPSDELVMLYAADGTPIAKIARDDLVKVFASVMASNSQTTFSKLLGVQANGTPMGIGPTDLASFLGGWTKEDNPSSLKKAYNKPFYGMYNTNTQDAPSAYGFYFAFPMTQPNGNVNNGLVMAVQSDFTKLFINGSWGSSGYNSKWTEVSLTQQN